MKHKSRSAIAALLIVMLLPSLTSAQLQWFGYAGGGTEAMLDRTTSYINFGYFITDSNSRSQNAAIRISAMAQRNMKAIVELGQLLWNPNSSGGAYRTLYGDYVTRWNNWKNTNGFVLTSDKVLGFLIRDEPFSAGVNISQWEIAARMVKQDFPWAKIMLVEAAVTVNDSNPASYFNQNFPRIQTVDWVGLDRYSIDPTTDLVFRNAVTKMKQNFPGRKFIYVADGWWNSAHAAAFGNNILVMRDIMTKWYDVARNDPDAALLGVFLWDTGGEITIGSDNFPSQVIDEHIRVGRLITGRVRPRLFQPVGVFEGYDLNFNAVGWACDPDSPWGEKVYVDFYEEGGGLVGTLLANQPGEFFPQCSTGMAHRFRGQIAGFGRRVIAVARDLDSGVVQLPSNCADAPACVQYFQDYAPIGEFKISSTGFAEGWTCDPDAPLASLKVEVWMDSTTPPLGTVVATTRANLTSDETINGQCGGGTAHRFGVQLPSSTKGHAIYIFGIDTMVGSSFLLTAPDSGCQAVGACIW